MRGLLIALSLAALAAPALAQNEPAPDIAAALADERRPAEDRARDEARQAEMLLALTEVGPGDHVADLVIGGGYFTRIFAALVGPEGQVYAWQPAEFIGFNAEYGANLTRIDDAYQNVTGLDDAFAELTLPEGTLDAVFTAQNYHDFHLAPFADDTAQRVNAEVFAALKPCGLYVINDHLAADGAGFSVVDTLHRADIEAVVLEVFEAGFILTGMANLPANNDDPRTANVFDESIQGRTDQFTVVFQKPGPDC